MVNTTQASYQAALRDFEYARKQAAIQQMLARVRGVSTDLLCYDTVRQQLRATGATIERGLQEIPLDKIVGSVGRYEDFTRSFLPKHDADQERWAGVRVAVNDMKGMAPIEVYQLGDTYFVQDGNHRLSVARQLGTKTISAYVTEVQIRVPLKAEDNPSEIICKSFYADFFERTNLDKLRPNVDLLMTFCGQYRILLDQISAEYTLLKDKQWDGTEADLWEQAVVAWYDHVYLPVVRIIRELGILHRFPERTETDMYVLLSERQAELEEALGWQVEMGTAVTDLIDTQKQPAGFLNRLVKTFAPIFDEGPLPGLWRQQQLARQRHNHLFEYLLVALDGTEEGWQLFEQTLWMAQKDHDHILGLHVVPDAAAGGSDSVQQLRTRFEQRCQQVGLPGQFAVEVNSSLAQAIVKRSAWADLVIVHGPRPVDQQPSRLGAGLKFLVQQCPRPIEIIPRGYEQPNPHNHRSRLLLAYDGSPKADEALFVAAYLTGRWHHTLLVVSVETTYTNADTLAQARHYLSQRGLTRVNYILQQGSIADAVMKTAETYHCQLLIMGGFSFRPMRHLVLGSTAERILREFHQPVLICR